MALHRSGVRRLSIIDVAEQGGWKGSIRERYPALHIEGAYVMRMYSTFLPYRPWKWKQLRLVSLGFDHV